MAVAAAPRYLRLQADGKENHEFYLSAPPGHRFLLYFPVWGENADTCQFDWRVSDRVPKLKKDKVGALEHTGWEDLNNKHFASAVSACQTPVHNDERPRARVPARDPGLAAWRPLLDGLAARQSTLATPLTTQGRLLTLEALSTAPFTTGLGNEHPLENGFAFLNPYGLPYLPGSGVKGVLRQAARELTSGEWGDGHGWTKDAITHLFGLESDDGDKVHQRGALSFWDVLPQWTGAGLQVEVMTPHQTHYYQKGDNPHDSGQPNPINFLTVPPGSKFAFHVQCDVPFLTRLAPALAKGGRWQMLMQSAFEHAFAWLGFGAKTAVGYGALAEDAEAKAQRAAALTAAQARADETASLAHIATLNPADQAWEKAKPALADFAAALDKARAAGAYNPSGPFKELRLAFIKQVLAWTEPRSRQAAAELLARSAGKDWGRPSKKERWQELQQAIAALKDGPT
jgi:CRISPR-associated protein Cmr6